MILSASKQIDGADLADNERFESGLNHLIKLIEDEKKNLNEKVYAYRRYGEIAYTTLYKDLKYLK